MSALACSDLDGWATDNLSDLVTTYARTLPSGFPVYVGGDVRRFLEENFRPVLVSDAALVTGYFEPELTGSLLRTDRFRWPLHAMPDSGRAGLPSRADLLDGGVLDGHEIAWLDDALDAFLAQVQGSVRVRTGDDGETIRLGYAGRNGHPYRSIGAELVARNEIAADRVSIATIREWCGRNPGSVEALLRTNPSYVFFRRVDLPPELGPCGSSGVPLTADRSLAADPASVAPGTLVWVETDGAEPIRRLFVAQDTGSAITGPGRADLFLGTGATAGERAGRLRQTGRVFALMPDCPRVSAG